MQSCNPYRYVNLRSLQHVILDIKNTCAHGNVLYDFTPEKSIRKGPAMKKGIGENQNLNGALRVVLFMMKQISENRYNDLIKEIDALIAKYSKFPVVEDILSSISGLNQLHRE